MEEMMGSMASEAETDPETLNRFVQGLSVVDEAWTESSLLDETAEAVTSEECTLETEASSLTEEASISSEIAASQGQPEECKEEIEEESQSGNDDTKEPPFRPGDHVYQWCGLLGIPRVFQHHGIVIGVKRKKDADAKGTKANSSSSENEEFLLTIVDFSNLVEGNGDEENKKAGLRKSSRSSRPVHASLYQSSHCSAGSCEVYPGRLAQEGFVRVYSVITNPNDKHPWHKVTYEDNGWNMHLLRRSGTCTTAQCDEPGMVVARAHFLIDADEKGLLPSYHAIHANCECAAVWCKTGVWATLQGRSLMGSVSVGSAKGVAAASAAAASTQVTVTTAAPGIWGFFGGTTTTTASLLSANPVIGPVIAAAGVVTVGGSVAFFAIAHKKWKATTEQLSELFRNSAMRDRESFARRVNDWNELSSGNYLEVENTKKRIQTQKAE